MRRGWGFEGLGIMDGRLGGWVQRIILSGRSGSDSGSTNNRRSRGGLAVGVAWRVIALVRGIFFLFLFVVLVCGVVILGRLIVDGFGIVVSQVISSLVLVASLWLWGAVCHIAPGSGDG